MFINSMRVESITEAEISALEFQTRGESGRMKGQNGLLLQILLES